MLLRTIPTLVATAMALAVLRKQVTLVLMEPSMAYVGMTDSATWISAEVTSSLSSFRDSAVSKERGGVAIEFPLVKSNAVSRIYLAYS